MRGKVQLSQGNGNFFHEIEDLHDDYTELVSYTYFLQLNVTNLWPMGYHKETVMFS